MTSIIVSLFPLLCFVFLGFFLVLLWPPSQVHSFFIFHFSFEVVYCFFFVFWSFVCDSLLLQVTCSISMCFLYHFFASWSIVLEFTIVVTYIVGFLFPCYLFCLWSCFLFSFSFLCIMCDFLLLHVTCSINIVCCAIRYCGLNLLLLQHLSLCNKQVCCFLVVVVYSCRLNISFVVVVL